MLTYAIFGPSGNGKTLLAHYLGNYCSVKGLASFVEVKAVDLISKVVGETEQNIRNVFLQARERSPCVLFLDQIETIAGKRTEEEENVSFDRILSILLVEIDGIQNKLMSEENETVLVIGATNNVEALDPAIKRSGRLGYHINISPPSTVEEIFLVLKSVCGKIPIMNEFGEISEISKQTVLFSLANKIHASQSSSSLF